MGLLNSKNRLSLLIAPGLVSSFLARLHLLRIFLNHPDPGEENERPYPSAYDMDMACLRIFTAYGPPQRPEMASHKFARLIDLGEKIPLCGDGFSRRD